MSQIIDFPHKKDQDSFDIAVQSIENRFGISFWEYMGLIGRRSKETEAKIEKALRKETLKIPLRDE